MGPKSSLNPKISKPGGKIILYSRIIAGLAFRPDPQFGIYLDMDVKKNDLLYNGNEVQPFSLGVEKGFFRNKFFIRAGFLNDLTEKYFMGKKSKVLYGFGMGFNMSKIIIDFALGLNSYGSIDSLAISGFFVIK